MKKRPVISIITVNLNNLLGLKRTMASVFQQTWQEFEYIVIDGGSIDGSKEYIENHTDRIDYWVSEKDVGVYNAMNKGIKKATGEYLLFLNSGDHFFDNEVLLSNKKEIAFYDLIYFNIQTVNKSNTKLISYPEQIGFLDFYYGTLCHQSVLIKKKLFIKVGLYDENLKFVSDWKFFILAIFKYNCNFKKIDKVLTTFYLNGITSVPENANSIRTEREEVLNTYFKPFLPEMLELSELRIKINDLKVSKKIKLLINLGMLNKF